MIQQNARKPMPSWAQWTSWRHLILSSRCQCVSEYEIPSTLSLVYYISKCTFMSTNPFSIRWFEHDYDASAHLRGDHQLSGAVAVSDSGETCSALGVQPAAKHNALAYVTAAQLATCVWAFAVAVHITCITYPVVEHGTGGTGSSRLWRECKRKGCWKAQFEISLLSI